MYFSTCPESTHTVSYSGSQKSEVCPMPYALCPMPYAHEYLIFRSKGYKSNGV